MKPVVNSGEKPNRDLDQFIDEFCQAWVRWTDTRKFYMQKQASNILGRMQPSKMREPPNARNSPDMQFFNNAVHSLYDMAFSELVTDVIEDKGDIEPEDDFTRFMRLVTKSLDEDTDAKQKERFRNRIDCICWMIHYDPQHKIRVKVFAGKLGIAPRTYYHNIKRFSRKAYSLSQSFKRIYESQQAAKVAA